jgi:hypothetical protein
MTPISTAVKVLVVFAIGVTLIVKAGLSADSHRATDGELPVNVILEGALLPHKTCEPERVPPIGRASNPILIID